MGENSRVKIPGFTKKVFFDGGIEIRPFNPSLVGNQSTENISDGSTPLFTQGNFNITTNLELKASKIFSTNEFSNFVTLSSLNLTHDETIKLLDDNSKIILNLDKKNLKNYAYFGSLSEYIRVSLEDIIIKWPASLFLTKDIRNETGIGPNTGFTVENYVYDIISNSSTFKVNTNVITNNFNINYLSNGTIIDSFNETNDIRNLTVNYLSYVIFNNENEYNILNFTGSTNLKNDFIYFKVNGDPFSSTTVDLIIDYHIKPKHIIAETFFNGLPLFEGYLLNRLSNPKYTSTFTVPINSEAGVLLFTTESLTWPVSDGYNIDFNTTYYIDFVTKFLDIANVHDKTNSDLITRFLVSESISSFDTLPTTSSSGQETAGQKMNKLLKIYGREYDEIKRFIDGIQFANVVTYDKEDNTPDILVKNLARVLGWELITSVLEHDLLGTYVTTNKTDFSGHSVGLTSAESETELWRRLILNTPWLWKSKGTRKGIEFLFKFIGVPNGLIDFNEYVYVADKPIDVELFKKVLELNNLPSELSFYNVDSDGYPKTLPNTLNMYFQKAGLWYRETAGPNSTIDILGGNNPHVGPYDGGQEYIDQFRKLIPNFSAVTITSETITTKTINLFSNYKFGTMDGVVTTPKINILGNNGVDISDCYIVTAEILDANKLSTTLTSTFDDVDICETNNFIPDNCRVNLKEGEQALLINVNKNLLPTSPCDENLFSIENDTTDGIIIFTYTQNDINGNIFTKNGNPVLRESIYTKPECCEIYNGKPELYIKYNNNGAVTDEGYICSDNSAKCGCLISCKWVISGTTIKINNLDFLEFTTPDNKKRIVTPDGCNCIAGYTEKVGNIKDPYTNEIGFGCKLTTLGVADLNNPLNEQNMYNIYLNRKNELINCNESLTLFDT